MGGCILVLAMLLGLAGNGRVQAEVVSTSAPAGILSREISPGLTGLAFPLVGEEFFSGMIAANSGVVLTLGDTQARPGSQLPSGGGRYYVEITSGPFEGERFDLAAAATIAANNATMTLDLSAASASTMAAVPANALASARCVVRAHVTLAGMAAMFSPALTGNNNYNLADTIRIHGPTGFVTYYLRSDGATWRTVGGTTDQRNLVIPPDTSVLVSLRSVARRWTHRGTVRTNVFRKNLAAGVKAYASGYPVPLSLTGISGFVDLLDPVAQRWTGSDDPAAADQLQVFNRTTGAYDTYYLCADGLSWRKTGGSVDVAALPLVGATDMLFVKRQNADDAYVVLRPFPL